MCRESMTNAGGQDVRGTRRSRIARHVARFRRESDGSLLLFGIFIFILMLMIGGMAVDIMRFETERTRAQSTLDRAVLAAADLDQTLDAEEIVEQYLTAAGLGHLEATVNANDSYIEDYNGDGDLEQELVGRTVTASANTAINTFFMHMLGINELEGPSAGSAIESIRHVEISLVLDISGSMRWDENGNTSQTNRIENLRDAVQAFLVQVLAGQEDTTSVNIIPYAGHVNPGPMMFGELNGQRWHSWSSCKELVDADFDNDDLPRASTNQLPHFMRWTIDWNWMNWGWCPKDNSQIRYAQNDTDELYNFIENVRLHDGTATHVGMKYGVALLNPSSRDEFDKLVDAGEIPAQFRGRPANFDEEGVVKYLIVMTDGKITDQWRPKNDDENDADYWDDDRLYDAADNLRSMDFLADPDHTEDDDNTEQKFIRQIQYRYGAYAPNPDDADDDDGEELSVKYAESADIEYGYPSSEKYRDPGGKQHNYNTNVGHFLNQCERAKSNGITVYTIAFLAPSQAQSQMQECASSTNHYFPITGLNIENAFSAIGSTINQLRLTQ